MISIPWALPDPRHALPQYDYARFRLFWSDNSRVLRTPSLYFSDESSWDFLYSYIHTLYHPKKGRPQRDPTMTLSLDVVNGKLVERWALITEKGVYLGVELIAASHHIGRQTCIFKTIIPVRIIKDIWIDILRRFKEHLLLKKAKGCSSSIQVEESYEVGGEEEEGKLRTPATISPEHGFTDRKKWRHVIHTVGESLRNCGTACHLLKTIYNALQGTCTLSAWLSIADFVIGHQALLMQKKILHRDVSFNNILTGSS